MIETQVAKYFKLLISNFTTETPFTWAWFSEATGGPVPGYGICHGTWGDMLNQWGELYKLDPSPSLHIPLNKTDLKGRRRDNMIGVQFLCLDLDKRISKSEINDIIKEYSPTIVACSSPEKYHVYWNIAPETPFEVWSSFQLGVAQYFGGDKNLSVPTALIRVPGFSRVTKEGKKFRSHIVHSSTDRVGGKGPLITEATIERTFPWIREESFKGQEALALERKEIAKLARKIRSSKASRSSMEVGGALAKEVAPVVPEAGRNSTLYLAVCDYITSLDAYDETTLAEALEAAREFGAEVNAGFSPPLSTYEFEKTLRSAISHSERMVLKQIGSTVDLLEVVDVSTIEVAVITKSLKKRSRRGLRRNKTVTLVDKYLDGANNGSGGSSGGNGNGNGHGSEGSSGADQVVAHLKALKAGGVSGVSGAGGIGGDSEAPEPTTGAGVVIESQLVDSIPVAEIPETLLAAAKLLSYRIWESELRLRFLNKMASSVRNSHFSTIAADVCEAFRLIGTYKVEGPVVYLKGQSRWGSTVFYGKPLVKEQFQALVCTLIADLSRRAVENEETKRIFRGKLLKQHSINNVATVAWQICIQLGAATRQSKDVVVFQNGVLDLAYSNFHPDVLAPLKNSHPIWARFDSALVSPWNEMYSKGWSIRELCRAVTPVFAKYMQEWFPDDDVIIKVMLRWIGYCFTTNTSEQTFTYFYGPTRAGKGSISRTLCSLVGDVNYCSGEYSMLSGGFRTANMHDKLVISIEEAEGTQKEHEVRMAALKKYLGGERVIVERKFQLPFEDTVIGKFMFQSNEGLKYQDKGHAIRSRMLAVGFERSFERLPGPDPAGVILKSEADALASLAALEWMRVYEERKAAEGTAEGTAEGAIAGMVTSEGATLQPDGLQSSDACNDVCSSDALSINDVSKPFTLIGCRALDVGIEEVVTGIDLVGTVLSKYVTRIKGLNRADADCYVPSQVLTELVQFVYDMRDIALQTRAGVIVKKHMAVIYPGARYSNNIRELGEGNRVRGYFGVEIELDALLDDYPELDEERSYYATKYPALVNWIYSLEQRERGEQKEHLELL